MSEEDNNSTGDWTTGGSMLDRLEAAAAQSDAASLQKVSREAVIRALELFDNELRPTDSWKDWQKWGNHKYAIRYGGEEYPVKKILSLASGIEVKNFISTTAQNYLTKLDFEIEEISRPPGDPKLPPNQGSPAFIVYYSNKRNEQGRYGFSYVFRETTTGDTAQLLAAIRNWQEDGPPVYLFSYRTGPYYSLTNWATVSAATQSSGGVWTLQLDSHELTPPLNFRGNIFDLRYILGGTPYISLRDAFSWGKKIHYLKPEWLQTLVERAQDVIENKPITITDVIPPEIADVDDPDSLIRDETFPAQVNGATFLFLHKNETEQQRYGQSYFFTTSTKDAELQNLHRAVLEFRDNNTPIYAIIYLPANHPLTDKPRKAFTAWARVKSAEPVADGRGWVLQLEQHEFPVPVYLSSKFSEKAELLKDPTAVFWGRFIRRIRTEDFLEIIEVAKEAAQQRMSMANIAEAIFSEYETEISLSLDEIARLARQRGLVAGQMNLSDLSTALVNDREQRFDQISAGRWILRILAREAMLPYAWERLENYLDFVDTLDLKKEYKADDLLKLAQGIGGLDANISAENLALNLRFLRLLNYNATQATYQRQPWTNLDWGAPTIEAEKQALLRIMALGLVLPVPTEEGYSLPVRQIIGRVAAATASQAIENFAPELGWESEKLLGWYKEAGLVEYQPFQDWKATSEVPGEIPGNAPAITAYNKFASALRQTYLEQAASASENFGPLSQVADFEEKLKELQREVLVDGQTVRRIYRSLLAGRHVILSGPPGTGKTLLAEKLPEILWRKTKYLTRPNLDPDGALVTEQNEEILGYKSQIVTATEDWSVRDVIGGISPRLGEIDGKLNYDIRYGALTSAVLSNYNYTNEGKKVPEDPNYPQRTYYPNETAPQRYQGVWLVIDEFNRAHIDAAFGSLLTTLSGKTDATLNVPTRNADNIPLKMPADFRIIGTLNSFDRHFLNQISEALKRRFDFIDILPPAPNHYEAERNLALGRTLKKLHANGFGQIQKDKDGQYYWPGLIEAKNRLVDAEFSEVLQSFSRIFQIIRYFRKLGTAQVEATLTNLLTGSAVGMTWAEALDFALGDTLADQLQVLTPDEQQILENYLEFSGTDKTGEQFTKQIIVQLKQMQRLRRPRLVALLRQADELVNTGQLPDGRSDIEPQNENHPTAEQLNRLFEPDKPLKLSAGKYFLRRLRELNSDRGI